MSKAVSMFLWFFSIICMQADGFAVDFDAAAVSLPLLPHAESSESDVIRINGDGDRIIENRIFRPRKDEYAIQIYNHAHGQIIIRNCRFYGGSSPAVHGISNEHGRGILAWQSSNITVESCYFEYIQGFCVRIMGSVDTPASNIKVSGNNMLSLQAYYEKGSEWGWTADAVQFIHVQGPGNSIYGNICMNRPNESYLTDFINIYCSSGTAESPLMVERNILVGAGAKGMYNQYGCGIQLNDHPVDHDGGEYVTAKDNLLVDPGIVGMNIDGGFSVKMIDNTILMSNELPTNLRDEPAKTHPAWAAITLFNYSGGITRDSNHEVRGNRVAFRNAGGTAFINKTSPVNTIIADNQWEFTVDWQVLVESRISMRNAEIAVESSANPVSTP